MLKPLYEQHVDDSGYIYFRKNKAESKNFSNIMLHMHNAVEFKFIVDGNYQIEVGEEKHVCKSGTIIFVDSCRPHAYKSIGSSTHFVLVVGKEIVDGICGKGNIFPLLMQPTKYFETDIVPMLEKTYSEWLNMEQRKKRGFVYRLVGTIMQYYDLVKSEYPSQQESFIAEILKYIEEHFNEELNLDYLSKKFGYSKNYFSNLFNAHIKMGLREYLNRCRIKKALTMMKTENGKMPLWRIAEHCGYISMNTFRRALKKYANETIDDGF